jgi:hypothetical protein
MRSKHRLRRNTSRGTSLSSGLTFSSEIYDKRLTWRRMRKPELTEHQKHEAIKCRDAGEPIRAIVRTLNVLHNIISRLSEHV